MGVTFDDKDYGYIVIIDEGRQELSSYESMILNHASTALKLIAQKYISNMEIESRYRDGLGHCPQQHQELPGGHQARQDLWLGFERKILHHHHCRYR